MIRDSATAPPTDRLAIFSSGTFALFAQGQQWRQPQASWSRCTARYGLKPDHKVGVVTVPESDYQRRRAALAPTLTLIGPEMHALFSAIRRSGYSLAFVDADGVTISYIGADPTPEGDGNGRLGAIWAEQLHGTNSAGTCLVERVPVALLGEDHFCDSIKHLVCASTPIFDWDGALLGALDVSADRQHVSEDVHRLVFEVIQAAGVRMEDLLFAAHFADRSVLSIYGDSGGCAMVALDDAERIVGLNRFAAFALPSTAVGRKIWEFLDRPGTGEASQSLPVRAKRKMPAHPSADPLDRCGAADTRLRRQLDSVRKVKDTEFPILLLGETGTGKDVLAQAIHAVSNRAKKPYVAFNCAAVPEALIDSELFGYGAGAFTGARREGSAGIFAAADGGTLFLDEIGDMPLAQQTRLLRVLESGEIMPLGTGKVRKVDVRVIAATHVELAERVRDGAFRSDLLYRLAGLVVTLPPLRERSDFDSITHTILAENRSRPDLSLSPEALQFLKSHSWPGNLRELRNVLVRAAYLATTNVIRPDDIYLLPAVRREGSVSKRLQSVRGVTLEAERALIDRTLAECDGDVSRAARELGVSRATLYRRLKGYRDIPGER